MTQLQDFPEAEVVRARIEKINRSSVRQAMMYQYLIAGRVSEVCGKYAPAGQDAKENQIDGHPVIVFRVRTAKRGGKIRACALPLEGVYEPWTEEIWDLFKKTDGPVFRPAIRTVQAYSQEIFQGLNYPIMRYQKVPEHWRRIATHGLRHVRATDLMMHYGFDGIDVAIFCGWSLRASQGLTGSPMPSMAEIYVYLQWERYVRKLLKPR